MGMDGNGNRGDGENGNGNVVLEWKWVGMGMAMIRWEWEGNWNKKVIPAHLYSSSRVHVEQPASLRIIIQTTAEHISVLELTDNGALQSLFSFV